LPAGADIRETAQLASYADVFARDFNAGKWICLSPCRKPVIAAVAGYALGGGCELAMMCDFILTADNARFGQLEVNVGISPGGGGTQRLPRFICKSQAMEMCLAGRIIDAAETERAGLVARVVPVAELVDEAVRTAARIASLSRPLTMMIKECVNRAYESALAEGLLFERRTFHAAFSLHDRMEGMNAFAEKRPARFTNTGRSLIDARTAESWRSLTHRCGGSERTQRRAARAVELLAIESSPSLRCPRHHRKSGLL
jgi:enoyl-CoA hydratase